MAQPNMNTIVVDLVKVYLKKYTNKIVITLIIHGNYNLTML